jgi:putative tricarboxylic transport membrane protein
VSERTGRGGVPPHPAAGRTLLGPRIAGALVLALGLLAAYQTVQLGSEEGYGPSGPAFFPLVVSAGLLVFGALFLLQALVRPDPALREYVAEEEEATHWRTVVLVVITLLVYAFLLEPLGYPVATSLFFLVVTRILGSRRLLRDAIIAVVLSFVLYFGFTEVLGVRLPGGVLDYLL